MDLPADSLNSYFIKDPPIWLYVKSTSIDSSTCNTTNKRKVCWADDAPIDEPTNTRRVRWADKTTIATHGAATNALTMTIPPTLHSPTLHVQGASSGSVQPQ